MIKGKDLEEQIYKSLRGLIGVANNSEVQELIEATIKSKLECYNNFFINSPTTEDLNKYVGLNTMISVECEHSWKLYEGFTSRFEFCEKCDQKR